jgi:putative ABC transport system permease protein
MNLASIGVRSVLRNRFRTVLTTFGVAVAIIAFIMLRTVLSSWMAASEFAAKDRIVTRHKVSFIMPLPGKYLTEAAQRPGIKRAAPMSWFGGKDPKHEQEFFGTIAVEPDSFLEVYDEILITPEVRDAWKADRQGAIVGDAIAKKLGWKAGDRVTLEGSIYPGEWQFTIAGIYTATRQSVDRATLYFHYNYLNEWLRTNNPTGADQVGWIGSRIEKGLQPAAVAKELDAYFEERDVQTLSQDEHSFNSSFLGMLSAILKALDIVSIVILAIMMLILGNTIAMGVRERTQEYGVLRAIGFLPKHLVVFVLGEAATVGLLGGGLGLALAYPLVERLMGRWLEENMGGFFPFFRIDTETSIAAISLSVALGLISGIVPAYQVSKLEVVASLRKVG